MRAELRQVLRSLRRTPWYSATVVGVIALTMTLATTVFAIVDGVLFKPLPYTRPAELYGIEGGFSWVTSRGTGPLNGVSRRDIDAWTAAVPEIAVGASVLGTSSPLPDGDTIRSAEIDRAFLDVLGVRPVLGGFLPAHFENVTKTVPALISYGLWHRRFGGEPSVLGTIVRSHGNPESGIEIVGVLPREFVMPGTSRQLVPEILLALRRSRAPAERELRAIARLPPPLTLETVRPRLDAAARAAMAAFIPRPPWPGISEIARRRLGPYDQVRLVPFDEYLTEEQRPLFGLVLALTVTLIGLAAVNIAGLTAARSLDHGRELSVRRALGASRWTLARLIVAETGAMVLAGSAAGALLAGPLLAVTLRLLPEGMMLLKPAEIDWRVLALTFAAAALATIAASLWPVATLDRLTRSGVSADRRVARRTRGWGADAVVTAQVALAVTLTVSGALFVNSLVRVWREDPGFDSDTAATLRVSLGPSGTSERAIELGDELKRLPGVRAASVFITPFMQRAWMGAPFERPAGRSDPPGLGADGIRIGPGFFEASQIPLMAGRLPTDDELRHGAPVVVVSQAIASAYWPNTSAVGQVLIREGTPPRPYTVIGVVGDVRLKGLDVPPSGEMYDSIVATPALRTATYLLSFTGDPEAGLASLEAAIQRAHPEYATSRSQLVDDAISASIRRRQFQTLVFASFGVSALVIVGAGILGLMAMRSARRTRELGIRMAIGATPHSVIGLLVREQVTAVAAGLAAGAVLSYWAVRAIGSSLYGTEGRDPAAWLSAAAVVVTVAAIGALVPAARASRIDPVQALRSD